LEYIITSDYKYHSMIGLWYFKIIKFRYLNLRHLNIRNGYEYRPKNIIRLSRCVDINLTLFLIYYI